jgi:hypothetical protein
MSIWKERSSQNEQAQKLREITCNRSGLNKRAIGLFPQPKEHEPVSIDFTTKNKFHTLLIDMEGREETCVMRLISPTHKTRAAVLIFRGRVLGCVYGQLDGPNQVQAIGKEAFDLAMVEMLAGETIIDSYKIDDKTAIAGSSIFHGDLYEPHSSMSLPEICDYAIKHLLESLAPGCIIVNDGDGAKAVIYTFKGKIHGVYSYKDGWLEPTLEAAESMLDGLNPSYGNISASKLRMANIWELKPLTFSLTGLEEQITSGKQYQSKSLDYDELTHIGREGAKKEDSIKDALFHDKADEHLKHAENPWKTRGNKKLQDDAK